MPSALLSDRDRLDFDRRLDLSSLQRLTDLDIHDDVHDVVAAAAGHEVLITKERRLDAATIAGLPESVRLVCEAGTGYDNIDLAAANERRITVCNVPGYSTDAVAQLCLAYLLGIASGTLGYTRRLARGDRSDFRRPASPFELTGKVLGLVGGGAIARAVARRAAPLGLDVRVWARRPLPWSEAGVRQVSAEELWTESDFVSLHVPLQRPPSPDANVRMVDAALLAKMKPTAWLINTARGGLVDEAALVEALRASKLAGAALDVQYEEPPAPSSPLWREDAIFLSPHVGWKTVEARQRLVERVADNITAWLRGAPINVVNTPNR